jgi:hypothetical protein
MSASNRAQIEAYIGASGSGKGVSVKRRLAELSPPRLLVWDARDEYGAHAARVAGLADLVQRVQAAGAGPFSLRYVPSGTVQMQHAFAAVCRLAMAAGRLVYVAEELSDVTTASHAPAAWRQCTTQGRHRGLHLVGVTQRPALVDKSFLGNATRVRCGVLGYRADRAAMAAELDCPPALLEGLESVEMHAGAGRRGPRARMQMLERDRQRRCLELVQVDVFAGGRVEETRRPAA